MNRSLWIGAAVIGAIVIAGLVGLAVVSRGIQNQNVSGPIGIHAFEPRDWPRHGVLGVTFEDETARPLTIQSVVRGSGAASAGLQAGDVVLGAGSLEDPDYAALRRLLQSSVPGEQIRLRVRREQDELEVRVTLMSYSDWLVRAEK